MAARVIRPAFRREAGNPSVEMIDSLHRSIANPISSSCQHYLRIDCAVADLPNFLVDAFYIKTPEASDNSLKRYLQKEDVITEDDVDPDGSFVVPDEYHSDDF